MTPRWALARTPASRSDRAALTVVSLIALPGVWRGGRRVDSWTPLRKAGYSLTALVYATFAVVLFNWGALSPWSG